MRQCHHHLLNVLRPNVPSLSTQHPAFTPLHHHHVRRASTLALGTAYEHTVAHSLRRLGFTLTRVGKSNDCGIDLVGTWALPAPLSTSPSKSSLPPSPLTPSSQPSNKDATEPGEIDVRTVKIPIFIQCKNLLPSRRSAPSTVRELEGAFPALRRAFAVARAEGPSSSPSSGPDSPPQPSSSAGISRSGSPAEAANEAEINLHGPELTDSSGDVRGEIRGAIGLLATTRPATKGVRDALARSRMPLGYLQITWSGEVPDEQQGGLESAEAKGAGEARVLQLLWNARAASSSVGEGALARCEVGVRYLHGKGDGGKGDESGVEMGKEIVLQSGGEVWKLFADAVWQ